MGIDGGIKKMEKNKKNSIKTTELMDSINRDLPYTDEKGYAEIRDHENILDDRKPFSQLKREIDRLGKEIKDLKEIVVRLQHHTHADGKVCIPEEYIESRRVW